MKKAISAISASCRGRRAHRKHLLDAHGDTRADRSAGAVAPQPHGGRHGDQPFDGGVHEYVTDHAQHHRDTGRRQVLRAQAAGEAGQVKADDRG
jgi:hypothetical protein